MEDSASLQIFQPSLRFDVADSLCDVVNPDKDLALVLDVNVGAVSAAMIW
jgi:hypothetical protein